MKINALQFALKGALILALVVTTTSSSTDTYAANANSNADAVVVAPIQISNTQGLDFGSFSTTAVGDTVTISAGGVRSASGAVPVPSSLFSASSFNVTGEANLGYDITLPASTTITNGTDIFTVDTFTSNPSGTGNLGAGGLQALSVGATVHTSGTLSPGAYTGTFTVDVLYN
jgi:Domain of unknown function (DUF4402)